MRPVERGPWPRKGNRRLAFAHYSDARPLLIKRIGEYCSYCERRIPASLAVEHVLPKDLHPSLERDWGNFLLGCTNCNSTKSATDVRLADYFWPDRDNTARAFRYAQDGTVEAHPSLDASDTRRARASVRLTGLHLRTSTPSDRRFTHRIDAWRLAVDARDDLRKSPRNAALRKHIAREAAENGHFSIWMEVFVGDREMRQRFIDAFAGTSTNCFDAQTRPVRRTGGAL